MKRHRHFSTGYYMLGLGLIAVLVAAVIVGCTKQPVPPPSGTSAEPAPAPTPTEIAGAVKVLVPCGQLAPFKEAQAVFMDKYPNVTLQEDVENINVLRNKLLEDKIPDADILLDMGDTVVADLKAAGKTVEGTETPYAQNWVGVGVPTDNPAGIAKFEDLAKPSVKAIALAKPDENSNGYYAREALKNAGMWDELEKSGKIVTVPQPAQLKGLVATKKVDAAFLYSVCANEEATKPAEGGGEPEKLLPEKVKMIGRVPEDLYTPFYCTATVLKTTQNEAAARKFVEFLTTGEASEIWQKFDYGPGPAKQEESASALLIHCGAGMRPPMDELAAVYEERTGTRVDLAYKGSGCLLTDIEFSQKGDLYMPGEQDYMDQAIDKGFITQQRPVAHMVTVIITPRNGRRKVEKLADLAGEGVKVGLGAVPQVAVGVAAEHVLREAGLWKAVQKNVTLNALNVVELANSVKLDGVDAAIVWDATAHLVKDDVNIISIEPKYSYRTTIPCGTLKFSRHPQEAKRFLDLVTSAEGAEAFESHGYGKAKT